MSRSWNRMGVLSCRAFQVQTKPAFFFFFFNPNSHLLPRADPADIDHAGGCPGPESGRDAECCTEYGFCHPRVSLHNDLTRYERCLRGNWELMTSVTLRHVLTSKVVSTEYLRQSTTLPATGGCASRLIRIYCTDQQARWRTQQCAARKRSPDTITC